MAINNNGGIDETVVEFTPGTTVLVGRVPTNRTSFLLAVMAGIGSENVSLKGDASEGIVELTIDGKTYCRMLTRQNGTLIFEGDSYLDDPELD